VNAAAERWRDDNRRYLANAIEGLRVFIETRSAVHPSTAPGSWEHERPPALDRLCELFGLSAFERDVVVLTAGLELDARFAQQLNGEISLGQALGMLDGAHWSAFAPTAALRRWRLVHLHDRGTLTASTLRMDERVLNHLIGIEHLDAEVAAVTQVLPPAATLPASQQAVALQVLQAWQQSSSLERTPIVRMLATEDGESADAVIATVCARLGLRALCVRAGDLPQAASERARLARLLERDALLADCAIVISGPTEADPARDALIGTFAASLEARVVVIGNATLPGTRPWLDISLPRASYDERLASWKDALGPHAARLNGTLERFAGQYGLAANAMAAVAASAPADVADDHEFAAALWESARVQGRRGLDRLAERIEPRATWAHLVLPEVQRELLKQVAVHVRQQWRVFESWGFAAGSARARGTCALFTGASGTGKTMAAEVLAHELGLDLYRVDLARVVSKYIGETEKNLELIFHAGETAGAILLFDEADALFGKRSEVQSSHDRYANLEVSYLLQRMESYRGGLAILTTNMKDAIDGAFGRRLRFIVEFPFPDAAHRAAIWRAVFPAQAPTEVLDIAKLARLNIAGGHIRSIAVNAAFRAAGEGSHIGMEHIAWAARAEFAKLGRAPGELAVLNIG
jgi:hypothetical protein